MPIQSPKEHWISLKVSVYGKTDIHPQQEQECSNAFYAGMAAGIGTVLQICEDKNRKRQTAAIQKYLHELEVLALGQNPTGGN